MMTCPLCAAYHRAISFASLRRDAIRYNTSCQARPEIRDIFLLHDAGLVAHLKEASALHQLHCPIAKETVCASLL